LCSFAFLRVIAVRDTIYRALETIQIVFFFRSS
jgi:hypothetical protein